MCNDNLFNQYIVYFKNNKNLVIWAKGYDVIPLDNGTDRIEFVDMHIDNNIQYINSKEVLFIRMARQDVSLCD